MKIHSKFLLPALLLGFSLVAAQQVQAQGNDDWRIYRPGVPASNERAAERPQPVRPGDIKIIADSRIENLNRKKIENPTRLNGYRVQIFFGDRSKAQEMRGEFIRKYPDTKAYISYLAPNFRLRVGDFRTRLECEKFKHQIDAQFPGSYIVKDKIELPSLEPESAETKDD